MRTCAPEKRLRVAGALTDGFLTCHDGDGKLALQTLRRESFSMQGRVGGLRPTPATAADSRNDIDVDPYRRNRPFQPFALGKVADIPEAQVILDGMMHKASAQD